MDRVRVAGLNKANANNKSTKLEGSGIIDKWSMEKVRS